MGWATLAATWSKILSCLFIKWIKVTVKSIDPLFPNARTVYSEDVNIRHWCPVHLRSKVRCMLTWLERTLVITQQSLVSSKLKLCPHIIKWQISALDAKLFFFKMRCVRSDQYQVLAQLETFQTPHFQILPLLVKNNEK